jgi:hypothetical protein
VRLRAALGQDGRDGGAVLSVFVGTVALLVAVQSGNPGDLVEITPAGLVTTLSGRASHWPVRSAPSPGGGAVTFR